MSQKTLLASKKLLVEKTYGMLITDYTLQKLLIFILVLIKILSQNFKLAQQVFSKISIMS
jgi:hypothetical protein